MMSYRNLKFVWLAVLALGLVMIFGMPDKPPVTNAQSEVGQCNVLVEQALQEVANSCIDIGRNEVCYGNDKVSAVLKDESLFFEAKGDIVPVAAIESIITRPADLENGEWGVALMDIQADLPQDSSDSVRIVLLGGVDVSPTVSEPVENVATCAFTNSNESNLNMRSGPDLSSRVVDILERGDRVEVYGQNEAGDWLRSSRGWVLGENGTLDCDADAELSTFSSNDDLYTAPMQSFTLQVDEAAQCQTAPAGLLIQSPTGQTANIMVNNVELRIGSTAFISITENEEETNEFIVANLEGNVSASINGSTTLIPKGAQLSMTMENGQVTGAAGPVSSFSALVQNLDDSITGSLPNSIEVPASLAEQSSESNSTLPSLGEGWQACGSCDTCGHPSSECVTSPEGACLWDPATCNIPAAPSITMNASSYNCQVGGGPVIASGNYNNTLDEAYISGIMPSSNDSYVANIYNYMTGTNTFSIESYCYLAGSTTVNVTIIDTQGRTLSTSYTVVATNP